jgi:seryl-tRNA synthetase
MPSPTQVVDGVVWLDPYWSERERAILDDCVSFLEARGLTYIAVPSSVRTGAYERQQISEASTGEPILGQRIGASGFSLAGSAEQGLLDRFTDQCEGPGLWVARNQCFRAEPNYQGLLRVREFNKVEQYCLCDEADAGERFEELLVNALDFLDTLGLSNRRVVDVTEANPGYHRRKLDIEVWTEAYGWMETHSCTDFADAQIKRSGIEGVSASLSNTGIASPRVLVPLMEAEGYPIPG